MVKIIARSPEEHLAAEMAAEGVNVRIFAGFISKSARRLLGDVLAEIFILLTIRRLDVAVLSKAQKARYARDCVLYARRVTYSRSTRAREGGKESDGAVYTYAYMYTGRTQRGSLRNPESNISMFSNQ